MQRLMDSAFFILSKIVRVGLLIETWLAVGLAMSILSGVWGRTGFARWSGSLTLIVLLVISILPLGELLSRPLEAQFPPLAPLTS